MTIKQIFDEISNESSTNEKMNILSKYINNDLLEKILYLANSKRIKFYIKQIPEYDKHKEHIPESYNDSLWWAINQLTLLSNRSVTGNAAIQHLKGVLESLDEDSSYIIERIIEKDCKIGMGTRNINKVFPDLIEKVAYLGAKSYSDKLVKNILKSTPINFSQEKMDGRYVNVIIDSGDVELSSRQGEPTVLDGAKFLFELEKLGDCVLNGELTMDSPDGGIMERYVSNGIIASLIDINKKRESRTSEETQKKIDEFEKKHMEFQSALNLIRLTVWDVITNDEYYDNKSESPYYVRFNNLKILINNNNFSMISLVETREVSTMNDVIEHFEDILSKNGEGTILKSYNGKWSDGKPVTQVKLKKEIELDLKIVGFNYGTGKNSNVISSLNCETECGLLQTSPTGMSEDVMLDITERQNELLGTVVAVKCSGLSQDSDKNYSLLHPVYKGLRIGEKDIANTLIECIEINKSSQFI
jgi:DNA ligase-1